MTPADPLAPPASGPEATRSRATDTVVRVAVDVPALADQRREFDYLAPAGVDVGAVVRVPLHGRRVRGWVVAVGVEPLPGVRLARVAKVTGRGPGTDVVELTAWGAWRWAGRRTALLLAASPPTAVRSLPPAVPWARGQDTAPARGQDTAPERGRDTAPERGRDPASWARGLEPEGARGRPEPQGARGRLEPQAEAVTLAADSRSARRAVVRLPPAADPGPLVTALLDAGPALVITPSIEGARSLVRRLRAAGWPVVAQPDGWARAAAGTVAVVGARGAAWAPAAGVQTMVVLDAHDAGLVETRAPAWSAWVVAAERAERAGVPCVLVTPCPLVEHLRWGRLLAPSRDHERRGWSRIEVLDRRRDDPRQGLLGERLVATLRAATLDARVVCVLNRKGRARALACRVCGRSTVCEHCGGGMVTAAAPEVQADVASSASPPLARVLACQRCRRTRPVVCQECGSTALRVTRIGVSKLRDDVEAVARLPVGEVAAGDTVVPPTPVLVGTEAVLNRVGSAAAVVLLDFDTELLAPRLRAAEEALALLARAARVAGGRDGPGRVVVQTRLPDHLVIQAAVRADPGLFTHAEMRVRAELALPPFAALAELSGDPPVVRSTAAALEAHPGIEVAEVEEGRSIARAGDHHVLCDALAATGRPAGVAGDRLRIEVDPQRV